MAEIQEKVSRYKSPAFSRNPSPANLARLVYGRNLLYDEAGR
jgi:hypothetical protein